MRRKGDWFLTGLTCAGNSEHLQTATKVSKTSTFDRRRERRLVHACAAGRSTGRGSIGASARDLRRPGTGEGKSDGGKAARRGGASPAGRADRPLGERDARHR